MADTILPEIEVSIDGEFTGPIPGVYSMISMGAVAYDKDEREISRFKVNLTMIRGTAYHPRQLRWWEEHPAAWEAAKKDPLPPWKAMRVFDTWLKTLPGRPRLIGWPLPVDFMFFYWYYWRYLKKDPPFGFDGIDIKTFAMCKLNKRTMGEVKHSEVKQLVGMPLVELPHIPDQDAEDQAQMHFKLRALP